MIDWKSLLGLQDPAKTEPQPRTLKSTTQPMRPDGQGGILSSLFNATTNDRPRVSFLGRDPEAGAFLQSEPGFVPGGVSFVGADPEANLLTDANDGLMRIGADPRTAGLQAQAQEQADHEASQMDLQSLAAKVSQEQQAREVATALAMRQTHERAEAQMASVGASGGPRRPMAPQVDPRQAGMLARLRGQTKGHLGRG